MDLPAELVDQAHRVAHDCDPLQFATPGQSRLLVLAEPDRDTGDRWVAEVVTDARGVATARVLPLPFIPAPGGVGAWVRGRLDALLAGDPDALSIHHAERAGDRAPVWRGEPRARVMPCARSPASAARVLERGIAEEDRHRQGAFYTSPAEIDLAARCGMFELLTGRLGLAPHPGDERGRLAEWVFGGTDALQATVAARILEILDELVLLDPACGAGNFLVGALQVAGDVAARAARDAGREPDPAHALEALACRARGMDVDRDALELARARLLAATGSTGDLVLADALLTPMPPADLIVGNPPYVRHEEIAPPGAGGGGDEAARSYKKQLAAAARARGHRVPARADLYVHFLHLAMDSLRPGGAAAMVTSASWLDLDFARELRARLGVAGGALRQVHESRAGRSFGDADINAVVLVMAMGEPGGGLARFVSWDLPFEDGLAAADMGGLLSAPAGAERHGPVTARVVSTGQLDPHTGWGGPLLRAPALYDRFCPSPGLVRLETVARVRFGLKTGANDFFYVDEARAREHRLAADSLRPVLCSARECPGYLTSSARTRRRLFSSSDPEADRCRDPVADYLAHGRAAGVDQRPSVASRNPWWDLGRREPARAILPRRIGDRFAVLDNDAGLLEDNNLFGLDPLEDVHLPLFLAALNSTWTRLALELISRPLTGAQPLIDTNVYIVRALGIPDLARAPAATRRLALGAWEHMRQRGSLPIAEECEHEDRRALDRAVLRHLGAAAGELDTLVDQLHRDVCEMVATRLRKADRVPRLHG